MTINVERAAVEIAASVTGTRDVAGLTAAMADLKTATADMDRQQKSFMNSLAQQTTQFGLSKSALLEQKAAMLGIADGAAPLIAKLKEMGIDGAAPTAIALKEMGEVGDHSFKAMITSGGVFRELLVLMHESIIMGNWSRFGGSLMVIAERMDIAHLVFTAAGGAILATAAAVGVFLDAVIKGEQESSRFAGDMKLTGGMAGITESQFRQMASTIATEIPSAVRTGRAALMDLMASGQFTGDTLLSVGQAAAAMAQYSGQSAADVVKQFGGMKDGAAEWAAKMNESYHFISLAQYDYIVQLQQQGQTEAAEKAAADDLYQSLGGSAVQNLGLLEKAWYGVRDAAGDAFNTMMNVGRAQTPQDLLNSLMPGKLSLDRTVANDGRFATPDERARDNAIDLEVRRLQQQIDQNQAGAAGVANYDQKQQAGIAATAPLKALLTEFMAPADKAAKDVSDLKTEIATKLTANPNDQDALYAQSHMQQLIDDINKRDNPKADAAPALNKPDANGYTIGSDDPAKLQTQLTLMQQYASATHTSEAAVLSLSISQGKLNGFTNTQIDELRKRAAADDQLAAARAAATAQQKYTDTMGGLQDQKVDLKAQIDQMTQYGTVTKSAELNMINLQIAQGKLDGVPQSELDSLRAAATDIDHLQETLNKYGRSAVGGTQQAFQAYVDQATDAGSQIKGVWNDVFTGMNDMLVAALTGGKFNFDKFAVSVIDDMLKMEIQTEILGPLMAKLGTVGAGASGGSGGWGIAETIVGDIASAWGGGFSGGFGSSMGGGMSDAALVAHQGFADGGIMTSRGPVPLNRYAMGGVANTPQVAMFGEGSGPEAYVPLPDGRSIPVSMKGGQSGGNTIVNHFHINSDGSTSGGDSVKNAQSMQRAIVYTIQQELIRQHRDGGIFSTTGNT